MNPALVIAFVVFDLLLTSVVLLVVLRRRAGVLGPAGLAGLNEVTAVMRPEIDSAFESGWSGDPASLPGVLTPLLARLESEMQARQMPADRETLKRTLASLVISHRRAKARDVREALAQVA